MSAVDQVPRLRSLIKRAQPMPSEEAGRQQPSDHCGLCGVQLPDEHRHVLDLDKRELHCACRACTILFDHSGAGGHHYQLIPERCSKVEGLCLDDLAWRALGIPVEMAFFIRDGGSGQVRAFYPSPAGVTESQLSLDAWEEIEGAEAVLTEIEPEIEALLVNRTQGASEAFLVGIDQCYRLVGLVRQHWQGFSGGDEVWRQIEVFFDQLGGRMR